MKFRNGFVSNSSSSSFIAIISEETFDKSGFPAIVQAYLKQFGFKKCVLDGKTLLSFQLVSGERAHDISIDNEAFIACAAKIAKENGEDFDRDQYIFDAIVDAISWLKYKYFRELEKEGKCIVHVECY